MMMKMKRSCPDFETKILCDVNPSPYLQDDRKVVLLLDIN